jgi:flagellar hook assembly protein FlgD
VVGVDDEDTALPSRLTLRQNYPNPFNPETIISFGLPGQSVVKLDVYDLLGRKVVTLMDNELQAGNHSIVWDGRDSDGNPVSSGVFFYNISTEYGSKKAKMTLLR